MILCMGALSSSLWRSAGTYAWHLGGPRHLPPLRRPFQVDILDLKPRPNPGKGGKAYGWTGSAWW
jgi:hypothetical protein